MKKTRKQVTKPEIPADGAKKSRQPDSRTLARKLVCVDADSQDLRTDAQIALHLGVSVEKLSRIRQSPGYLENVLCFKKELFRQRDLKPVWNAYVEKAKKGDVKICERLLEEFGWLAARNGSDEQAAPEVIIVNRLKGEY